MVNICTTPGSKCQCAWGFPSGWEMGFISLIHNTICSDLWLVLHSNFFLGVVEVRGNIQTQRTQNINCMFCFKPTHPDLEMSNVAKEFLSSKFGIPLNQEKCQTATGSCQTKTHPPIINVKLMFCMAIWIWMLPCMVAWGFQLMG